MLSKYRKIISSKRMKELALWTAILVLPGGVLLLGFKATQNQKIRDLLKSFNRRKKDA